MLENNSSHSEICSRTSLIQLGYGVWVNLAVVVAGMAYEFSAVAEPQMIEDEDININVAQQSWIASILLLSCPPGCLISGLVIDRYGRQRAIWFSEIPFVIGWTYTALAKSSAHLIIGRIITGFGVGMAVPSPRIYTTEITLPELRGVTGGFPNVALSFGILIQATLGSILRWRFLCLISALNALLLFVSYAFLPETPYYTLMKDTEEQARKSLKKFRAADYDIEEEIRTMKDFKTTFCIRRLTMKETLEALKRRSSCKPFTIIMIYIIITQISGVTTLTFWTIRILEGTKNSVDPHVGNVLISLTRLISSILTSILLRNSKRRTIALISGLGLGVSLVSVGLNVELNNAYTLIPQILLTLAMMFSTLGHLTLPMFMMSEMYPLQVRGVLGGFTVSLTFFLMFVSVKVFPDIERAIGMGYTTILFGVASMLGCIYLYLELPETRGLTLHRIEQMFNDYDDQRMEWDHRGSLPKQTKQAKTQTKNSDLKSISVIGKMYEK